MDAVVEPVVSADAIDTFITRWKGSTGSERANFQTFMGELCALLQLPAPDPGKAENAHNGYVFERFIAPQRADSTTEKRYVRGLPLEEMEHGRPPFVVVVDVGNAIYLFADSVFDW